MEPTRTSLLGDELRSPPQPSSGEQGRKAHPEKGASETQPGQPNHRAVPAPPALLVPPGQRPLASGVQEKAPGGLWSVPGLFFTPEGLAVRASFQPAL